MTDSGKTTLRALWTLRLLLPAAGAAGAAYLADAFHRSPVGWGVGFAVACGGLLWIETHLSARGFDKLVPALLCAGAGVALAIVFSLGLRAVPLGDFPRQAVSFSLMLALGYLGFAIGARQLSGGELPGMSAPSGATRVIPKILDTSVVIDGRIADVVDTGFVDGPLVVPRFVLQELQRIADSGDPIKRGRGRRGLDILNRLQRSEKIEVRVTDRDFPRIPEVDEKLVALAQEMRGKIVTNDFNLNKVAELQQVPILNLNDLAGSVRPPLGVGDTLPLKIVKEGREAQQGVGYLDDGTMIIVENGRKLVGQTVEITIASVHQTSSGRMFFARRQNGG